jgi:hypothetical protein
MREFLPYLQQTSALFRDLATDPQRGLKDGRLRAALDGAPRRAAHKLVAIETLRASGAFFTGSHLARRLVKPFLAGLSPRDVVLDPTCGVGDLLVAASEMLPTGRDLRATLAAWGSCLSGLDIHAEFVEVARLRIALAAIARGARGQVVPEELAGLLPFIRLGDAMHAEPSYRRASYVLANPPFTRVPAPDLCTWGSGKVNAAALFMEHFLTNTLPATKICAILPDVLRSGSRYERWRSAIAAAAVIDKVRLIGRFDKWADVDVFCIELTRERTTGGRAAWPPLRGGGPTVGALFSVRVGAVVPHRHPEIGKRYAYIHAKSLPMWGEVRRIQESRRFSGPVFQPPFVAVRRTSKAGEGHRAIATIVEGKRKVAVENHLLVLTPRDGTLDSCRQLVAYLNSTRASRWLDKRIRCRHLTVGAVAELPWRR